jgi:hypothetical protein
MTTYIFENVEVKLTGREASRALPSGKLDILVEITPVLATIGTWKKWVRMQQMFFVEQSEDE